ncbi:hypothetical protein CO731_01925 [Aminobacter sp. MSH1]|nr:hypothetical protein CO731_01925 [Aminobacter sp. MSH1]
MAWVAAAMFGVAVIYFAIHYPGFRKVVLWCLAGIVALGAVGGAYAYWDSVRQAKRTAYAKTLINERDVDFYDLTMGSNGLGGHTVKGTVRNRSSHILGSFKLRIIVQDCPEGKCETIGENEIWETYINVPPGQVRAFDTYVSFYNMPAPKAQRWNYGVMELEAKLD